MLQLLGSSHKRDLQSTVYKMAHHGAYNNSKDANRDDLLEAVKPKATFVSSDPWHNSGIKGYYHPRCAVIDRLKQ